MQVKIDKIQNKLALHWMQDGAKSEVEYGIT
jgi:hypothetical protein